MRLYLLNLSDESIQKLALEYFPTNPHSPYYVCHSEYNFLFIHSKKKRLSTSCFHSDLALFIELNFCLYQISFLTGEPSRLEVETEMKS